MIPSDRDATTPVADEAQLALNEQPTALAAAVTGYLGPQSGQNVLNAVFDSDTHLVVVVCIQPGGRLTPRVAITLFRQLLMGALTTAYQLLGAPGSQRSVTARVLRPQ